MAAPLLEDYKMKCFDYDNMPLDELRDWLGHIAKDIEKESGFANVRALKLGAITSALKRIDRLEYLEPNDGIEAKNVSVREIMENLGI